MGPGLTPPSPLSDQDSLADFDSGVTQLDEWLKRRAWSNQASGASRTFVVRAGERVVAYYALAAGSVRLPEAPSRFRRNMPDPIPVAVLARLAIDRAFQARGLGRALVRDAGMRLLHAGEVLGIRGMLVHAISREARDFYLVLGFSPSPINPMTLMVRIVDIGLALGD